MKRIDARKKADKANFSTIVMRIFLILIVFASIVALAVQIIVYN